MRLIDGCSYLKRPSAVTDGLFKHIMIMLQLQLLQVLLQVPVRIFPG